MVVIPEDKRETILEDFRIQNTPREYIVRAHAQLTLVLFLVGIASIEAKVTVRLVEPGAEATIVGIVYGNRSQAISLHTIQQHEAKETTSDLLVKGVFTDRATFTYDGGIRVEKDAQKTNAYQRNENLLLSESASAESKPSLEILANDVRCTHGATIGTLDEEQLFYLASRGIREKQARRLIVEGFFEHAMGRLSDTVVKETIHKKLWQII